MEKEFLETRVVRATYQVPDDMTAEEFVEMMNSSDEYQRTPPMGGIKLVRKVGIALPGSEETE